MIMIAGRGWSMFGGRKQTVDFDRVDTILGQGSHVKGTVKAEGTLRIDGAVEGEVVVNGDLIVSESARLKADIHGRHATVAGEINGDIDLSGRLEITATGKIYGQIKVASLAVSEGGFFIGNCSMRDPKDQTKEATKQEKTAKPSTP